MGDEGKIDPSSPFYLGSGDQPGNLITHVILKGDNYLSWSRAITLSFESRRKFGFVDGTISKPTEKKKMLDWDMMNSMLVSWILRAIEPKLAASIPSFDEAKRLWDYLEKRYCEASGPCLQQLRASITNCKQLQHMSVKDYYNQLMGFFDNLVRLKPPHGCECGNCSCNVAAKYESDRQEEKLHQFLVDIDDVKYAVVRTNLLLQQPPTTLDRALQALIQEERSCNIAQTKSHDDKAEAHVFALPDRGKNFSLQRDKSKGGTSSALAASRSAAPAASHSSAASRPAPAAAATDHGKGAVRAHAVGDVSSSPSQDTLFALKELQLEHIIETGASHHVTGDESFLMDVQSMLPCLVGLPDGAQAATKEGRVFLADGIILKRDQHSGSLIGRGERIDGLYYFWRLPTVCAVTGPEVSTFELWHWRLGHLSDRAVKLVPVVSASSVFVKYVRSDNGTEFRCMIPYFDERGILFQTSYVGTPQQDGHVERKHQHILNVAWALMFQGNLPIGFWGECVLGAVYLINRTPSRLLNNKTPYEILFGKEPNFEEMHVFGSLCFAHNQKAESDKLSPRSRKCVFVGYLHGKKGLLARLM
ncbi:uncharacterized protein LOC110721766 [Chenopodium quinoa]|uniref:uncharacterized protein LOC110721766 n=1 Tax=Chenopodium quinoa TaxID=63459 RepID=UPI000B792EB9|nr:uncharacterized protein LOC110721766 [Chenopodium quinoa]